MVRNLISMKFNFKEDFKYPFFLISLASFLFVPSFVGLAYTDIISKILFIFLIISSLALISTDSRLIKILTYIVGITGISADIFHQFIYPLSNTFRGLFMSLLFVYFILIFSELISQIFKSKVISLNIVLGAFTGYIMIGIIGYFIFKLIFLLDPSSFSLPKGSTQELLYYAFITLTTIGYGDIAPLTESARNFAIILGLIGQFYNTVIIAIIIGKFLQK